MKEPWYKREIARLERAMESNRERAQFMTPEQYQAAQKQNADAIKRLLDYWEPESK